MNSSKLFSAGLLLLALVLLGADTKEAKRNASRHVADGIEYFREQAWEDADKAFSEADVELPEEPRIAFNRGCVALAQKDWKKAIELFRKSAVSADQRTVAESHYNLGMAYSAQAKATFGDQPEDAEEKVRTAGLEQMRTAVRHLRNALETDPDHEAARKNLELIRLWIKHMSDVWAERDRQKRRDKLSLFEFLGWMQDTQDQLRELAKPLAGQSKSPKRFYGLMALAEQQKLLRNEHEALNQKIEQTLRPQAPLGGSTGNATPPEAEQREQAIQQLKSMTQEARDAMDVAVGDLRRRDPEAAIDAQKQAWDHLDQVMRALAPFDVALDRAKAGQKRAIAVNEFLTKQSTASQEDEQPEDTRDEVRQGLEAVRQWAKKDLLWRQEVTTRYIDLLDERAKTGREQLRQQLPPESETDGEPAPTVPANPEQQQQQAQLKAMLESMEKAVELAPQARKESEEAIDDINGEKLADARTHQDEVMRLLNEIDKRPPEEQNPDQNQEDQNQNQDQNEDQQNQNQQNQDRQNQDQNNQDQQNQDGQDKDRQDKDQQDKNKGDDKKKDQEQSKQDPAKGSEDQKKSSRGEEQRQRKDQALSRREAEAVLQRARERERNYRDRKRRYFQGGRIRVDKDW